MSRFHEWTSAWNGMINYMNKVGIRVYKHNTIKEGHIFNDYCRKNKIKGSFSERVLLVEEDFESFRKYIDEKSKRQKTKNS